MGENHEITLKIIDKLRKFNKKLDDTKNRILNPFNLIVNLSRKNS
jgi:hypothetical protein